MEKHGFKEFAPKAVLFDMDGVIFDTMPNHASSWQQSMSDYGLSMEAADAYRFEGMRGVETIRLLASQQWNRQLTDEEAQTMYAHKSELFSQCPQAIPMKGIVQLMRQIKYDGLKICVVTGSGQHVLLDRLEKEFYGLVSADLIITAFDVSRGKPAPDPYLAGLRKCNVLPFEAIVVENAPLGVRSAVASRCFTIAVNTGPLPDSALADEGADIVLGSVQSLNMSWNKFTKAVAAVRPAVFSQDDRWAANLQRVREYITLYHRLPSRHRLTDHKMLSWIKHTRRQIAAGKLPEERLQQFAELQEYAHSYRRVNQYV